MEDYQMAIAVRFWAMALWRVLILIALFAIAIKI